MIEIENEEEKFSGPWVAEFGSYEEIGDNGITVDECMILDSSSPRVCIIFCDLKNIRHDALTIDGIYNVKRSSGSQETLLYRGLSRITKKPSFIKMVQDHER